MVRRALITGITGQDGSYLAESLLESGYEVHGLVRQASLVQRTRLDAVPELAAARDQGRLQLHYADLTDSSSLQWIVRRVTLAGQSHVKISFDMPEYTAETTGIGTLRLLEAVRQTAPQCRFFFAATSEMYGDPVTAPQNVMTPFAPINPYAAAKLYALTLVRIYRRAYGMFACAAIMFNHESPRRGENYVTRKIARAAARISRGMQEHLSLGTLTSRRDWGYAVDTVRGMRAIAEVDRADEYVLATGESHSVEGFCRIAFAHVGLDWSDHVVVDPRLVRLTEIHETRGDASRARNELGWRPSVSFDELVRIMVDAELRELDCARRPA